MRYLSGEEAEEAMNFMDKAIHAALGHSTCLRLKCGSVIVNGKKIIGYGYNSPPADKESQRRCSLPKEIYHKKVTDKTCCVHEEQRAMIDALKNNPEKIKGSRLYFIMLGEDGNKAYADRPYCTICSKMALDIGISEFVLWHKDGICAYGTEEYNELSFGFGR